MSNRCTTGDGPKEYKARTADLDQIKKDLESILKTFPNNYPIEEACATIMQRIYGELAEINILQELYKKAKDYC